MSLLFRPIEVAAILAEWVRHQQEKMIEFLQEELEVLREQMGDKRILLTDDQRRILAVKGMALDKEQLERTCIIVQPDTLRRWHRELVEGNRYKSGQRKTGRPSTDHEIVDLVLRMARENASWGYKRIEGALSNVGYDICSSTVANILKQHGIEPAPTRKRTTSWSTFLKAHWDVFEGLELGAITLWLSELARYAFGRIPHSRAISCPAIVKSNDEAPGPRIIAIQIVRVPEKAAQPTRGPPTVARPSISFREIRGAA